MNAKTRPASARATASVGKTSTSFPEVRLPGRIVVGVEEGRGSDEAVKAGEALAGRLRARLDLVHAVRVPIFEWMASDPARGPAAMARSLEAASLRVNDHVRKLLVADVHRGAASPVRACAGPAAAVLLDAAREGGESWILLGPHVKRGVVDFGSTARTVLAKGAVPAWIQVGPQRPVTRILAPIDLSPDSLRSLALACAIAKAFSATVRAVHYFDAAELFAGSVPDPLGYAPAVSVHEIRHATRANFDAAMSSFDWLGVDHTVEFEDGRAAEAIHAGSRSSDLVVLGTHGRTGLTAGALGGVTHAVLRRSVTPVLAVPYPGRTYRI